VILCDGIGNSKLAATAWCGAVLILTLVLLAACSNPSLGTDASTPEAKVQVSVNYVYYRIEGSTVDELRAQMDAQGRTDEFGHHWDAYTDWYVSWSYPYSIEDEKCGTGPVEARVAITFTFPVWDGPEGTPLQVVEKWNDYLVSLEVHEDGHKEIAVAAAYEVVEALEALPVYSSCSELEQAADSVAQIVLQRYRQQELIYDKTTSHGATQGVSFP